MTMRAEVEAPKVTPGYAPSLELIAIHKSFGAVQALKGVDLTILPGEVHAVVGENGAGKSTLLGVAAAYCRQTQERSSPMARRSRCRSPLDVAARRRGCVPATDAGDDLTVLENLQLVSADLSAGRCGGVDRARRDPAIAAQSQEPRRRPGARPALCRRDCAGACRQTARRCFSTSRRRHSRKRQVQRSSI